MPVLLLPKTLQNQIAAGEVVERPASVVKELVENSIDAGATEIFVGIEEGGLKEIRIVDNGYGMNEQDALMSFERYATSKIATVDDLFTLSSFGFRGEAIAAIASVSHIILKTKQEHSPHGIEIINAMSSQICACATGTEILVQNLFWNVPARKKFMKTPETESREIMKVLENFALSHPSVAFRFENNGKEIFSFPIPREENIFLSRCKKVLGESIAPFLLPVQYDGNPLCLQGFASQSSLHRSSKDKQFFFVNGRMIQKDSLFGAAIQQSYQSLLPNGKHPVIVLSLSLPPDQVDVNVHPRKLEVKFTNPSQIFQILKEALVHALSRKDSSFPVSSSSSPSSHFSSYTPPSSVIFSQKGDAYRIPSHFPKPSFPSQKLSFFPSSSENNEFQTPSWKIIGQARNSFILVEESDGIRIIDQHAAHERVRYEKYMKQLEEKTICSQPLLTPVVLSLSHSEKNQLLESQDALQDLGFEIEDFGGNDIAVTAVPVGSEHVDVGTLFSSLLADLDFFDPAFGRELKKLGERMVSYTACRGAKKFGDSLTFPEMESLVKDWKSCKIPDACAHGRRVSVFYPFKDLENECGRY